MNFFERFRDHTCNNENKSCKQLAKSIDIISYWEEETKKYGKQEHRIKSIEMELLLSLQKNKDLREQIDSLKQANYEWREKNLALHDKLEALRCSAEK